MSNVCARPLCLEELALPASIITPLKQIILSYLSDDIITESLITRCGGFLHVGFHTDIKITPGPLYLTGPIIINEQRNQVLLIDTRTRKIVATVGRFQSVLVTKQRWPAVTWCNPPQQCKSSGSDGHVPHGFAYISDHEIYFIIDHEVLRMNLFGSEFHRMGCFYYEPVRIISVITAAQNTTPMGLVSLDPRADYYASFRYRDQIRTCLSQHVLVHDWAIWGGPSKREYFTIPEDRLEVHNDKFLCSKILAVCRDTPNLVCAFKQPGNRNICLCFGGVRRRSSEIVECQDVPYKKKSTITLIPGRRHCWLLVNGVVQTKVLRSKFCFRHT